MGDVASLRRGARNPYHEFPACLLESVTDTIMIYCEAMSSGICFGSWHACGSVVLSVLCLPAPPPFLFFLLTLAPAPLPLQGVPGKLSYRVSRLLLVQALPLGACRGMAAGLSFSTLLASSCPSSFARKK